MDRLDQLISRYLDGLLPPTQYHELVALIDSDPGSAARLAEMYALHRRLEEHHSAPASQAVDRVLADIAGEEEHFVDSVLLTVKREHRFRGYARWPSVREVLLQLWTRPVFRYGCPLAGMALALVGLFFWLFPATNDVAKLRLSAGTFVSIERGSAAFAAQDRLEMQPGDTIRVSATGGPAMLNFAPENTTLTLRPGTELKLASSGYGKRFELHTGNLEALVDRQRPFNPMIIRTAQAEARILGTRFALARSTNFTRLQVSEGRVRFTRVQDGAVVEVGAGSYAVSAQDFELHAQPVTGRILREYWTNFPGVFYTTFLNSNPAFPHHPDGREYLSEFEAPAHWGRDYGARICGYLHPPKTGEYTFWIAAANGAELWLSPDDNPSHRQQIGHAGNTGPQEWTKSQSQESSRLKLVAGRKYYIEAQHKHGSQGEDHLAVAWQGPGWEREVIPGEFLSPFQPRSSKSKP